MRLNDLDEPSGAHEDWDRENCCKEPVYDGIAAEISQSDPAKYKRKVCCSFTRIVSNGQFLRNCFHKAKNNALVQGESNHLN